MTKPISYVMLVPEAARRLDLPEKFLTDCKLPLHVREQANFIAEGLSFESLVPIKDKTQCLPQGCYINVLMRTEALTRVTEFKPVR